MLQFKTSFETIKWLIFQTCAFRGHEKSQSSKNCENVLKMLEFLASYNDNVTKVLDEAPKKMLLIHMVQKKFACLFN